MVPRRRPARRSGAHRRRGEAPRRFRRAVPAGDRRQLPGSPPRRQRAARTSSPCSPRCCRATRRFAGVAVDHPADDGSRRRFGNMILSRLPVRQVYRHLLPYPGRSGSHRHAAHRGRGGRERAVRRRARHHDAPRVLFARKRSAQVEALRAIYAEGHGHARRRRDRRPTAGRSTRIRGRRRRSSPATSTSSPTTRCMRGCSAPFADGTPPLVDAWEVAHPGAPHRRRSRSREGVPGDPELHCDFIFVSAELRPRVRPCASTGRRRRPTTSR